MAVTFLNQLLFVQFQRETTQNKKVIRGLPPFLGQGWPHRSPAILLPTKQTFCSIFSGAQNLFLDETTIHAKLFLFQMIILAKILIEM